jgi:hypothetical protein
LAGQGVARQGKARQGTKEDEDMNEKRQTITTEAAEDTQFLCRMLRDVPIGGEVTHQAMSEAIGRDVQGNARYVVSSARRILEREGIVFGALAGVGLRRLDDVGKIGVSDDGLSRIRRMAKHRRRVLDTVTAYDELAPEAQAKLNMARSVFGAIGLMTGSTSIRKLESAVAEKHAELAAREALKLFAHE